jgi:hypothetical protein
MWGFGIRRFALGAAVAFVVLVGFVLLSSGAQAQNIHAFTPDSAFIIPERNGTVYFAVNGTYSEAQMENNSWVFRNLQLTNSPFMRFLSVSTENCNVTISSFAGIITTQNSGAIHYNVTAAGTQTFNFGLNPAFAENPKSHLITVRFNQSQYPDYHPQGEGWTLSRDGTITVTHAMNDTYIIYRDFSSQLPDEELPFYQNHLVLVVALASVGALVLIGAVVKLKTIRSGGKT